ncbi:MAG: 2Fe-2S iron-sulfur cluster-binding protein [Alphaproteobacteria bacterium]|nr:2Fe-2S iron-sulfur cluster-binding protein [Alphaproteobacteria bacterium]|tara:strand:+ start:954 stop:1664 length:711 start_codon:yes stop_codon:yes gene_type:complete
MELVVDIWRGAADGAFQSYPVTVRPGQTVLDLVVYVQRHLDSTLSYRYACRVGMCGSCAMTVNGVPRWTCRTRIGTVSKGGKLTLAPLRNLPHIKDLACDMAPFFDKLAAARGCFVPGRPGAGDMAPIAPSNRRRQAVDAAIECIGCGVCYAACDVVAWRPDFVGPAALNRAWTLVNDERDGDRPDRLAVVAGDAGCHACHSQQNCARHCPKALNPTASIAGLKRAAALALLKGEL